MGKRKIKKECGRRNFLKGGKMKEQKKLYKELGHTLLQGNLVYHLLCQEKGRIYVNVGENCLISHLLNLGHKV